MARGLCCSSSRGKEQEENIAGIVFIKQINRLGENEESVGTFVSLPANVRAGAEAGSWEGNQGLSEQPRSTARHLHFWGGPAHSQP